MRHLYLQRIKRLAGRGVYHRRIVIHDAEAAIGKPSFIAWRIQDNADAAGGMHPHTSPFRIISGKNKHMAPAVIIRKESQITRQQLRCGDAVGIRVLSVAAGADFNAYCRIEYPCGESAAIKTKGPNRAGRRRTG